MPDESALKEQASGTAMDTAFMRALAACDPRKEIAGGDQLAEIFLDDERRKPLKDPAIRAWIMRNKLTPGAYEFMIVRTAYMDEVVKKALNENIGQIVFLGAGYDSRPYRFRSLIQDTVLFELDTRLTQERKKACLQRAQVEVPDRVRFVPVNFEAADLQARLAEAGYCPAKSGLFIWEGVSYYLTPEAVNSMLRFVSSCSSPGSSICFDFASLSPQALTEEGATKLRQLMKSQHADEPTRFGIRAGELETYLRDRGYEVMECLGAADMNDRYLGGGRYPELGKVPSMFCIVLAKVIGTT